MTNIAKSECICLPWDLRRPISSLRHILMVKLLGTRSQLVIDCPDRSESSVKDGQRRFYQFGPCIWSFHSHGLKSVPTE